MPAARRYRFLHILDIATGEVIYELEHEIRALDHPGFSCRAWLEGEKTADGDCGVEEAVD